MLAYALPGSNPASCELDTRRIGGANLRPFDRLIEREGARRPHSSALAAAVAVS